jgi:hypothetical protein
MPVEWENNLGVPTDEWEYIVLPFPGKNQVTIKKCMHE